MKIELPEAQARNMTAAHIRQECDTRPLWLRIRHWLCQVQNSQRQLADSGKTVIEQDQISQWRSRYQQKQSLFL